MTYRAPWTGGAKAYPEADTFGDLWAGVARKRKTLIVHMPNTGEAGDVPCASCGALLRDPSPDRDRPDVWSTWHVAPRSRQAAGQHYACSWGTLLSAVFARR